MIIQVLTGLSFFLMFGKILNGNKCARKWPRVTRVQALDYIIKSANKARGVKEKPSAESGIFNRIVEYEGRDDGWMPYFHIVAPNERLPGTFGMNFYSLPHGPREPCGKQTLSESKRGP
jgi:hypothetical protein